MGSRIAASAIATLALAALAWVLLAPSSTDSASESPIRVQADAETSAAPDEATEPAAADTESAEPASANDSQPETPEPETAEPDDSEPEVEEPENFGPRMDLVELDGWLNTDATSIDDFNGQVLLVEMWTFGCHNCKARIPYNQGYYEEFADENFEIIGVHAPEFSFEAEIPNIIEAAANLGVDWPIALDTTKKNFRAWQPGRTNFWPRTYVIDQNGDIRFDHIGEGKYEEVREVILYLLENPPAPAISQ